MTISPAARHGTHVLEEDQMQGQYSIAKGVAALLTLSMVLKIRPRRALEPGPAPDCNIRARHHLVSLVSQKPCRLTKDNIISGQSEHSSGCHGAANRKMLCENAFTRSCSCSQMN